MTPADFKYRFTGRRLGFSSESRLRAAILTSRNTAGCAEHLVLLGFSLKMSHYQVVEVFSGILVNMPDNYVVISS